jgi:hypothetical protein
MPLRQAAEGLDPDLAWRIDQNIGDIGLLEPRRQGT